MSKVELEQLLRDAEALLAGSGELPAPAAKAVGMLLNAVEALCSDKQELLKEVERLRQQLEEKKRGKTPQDSGQAKPGNFSSEKRRTDSSKPPLLRDRRSGKELEIHETIACPVDVTSLPADAVRVADESVIVQNVVIEPYNIEFRKEVYFSASENEYYRGALPVGFDEGDFGPDLRALILSLKYCGNMSEPKIGELLENFGVEVSSGSLSNILTKTADQFEETYHQVLLSGLSSTSYQQTDDTSARVAGQSWHTHIICNPFYTFYSTRPGKDRLNVLCALQNVSSVRYRFNHQTLNLLDQEFEISAKWRAQVQALIDSHEGDVELESSQLEALLDQWMKTPCVWDRLAIRHAGGIIYYRTQTSVPVIGVLVCDDARQFKLLTQRIGLCWIHEGRHYERLTPVAKCHQEALGHFRDRFWEYYGWLGAYREHPSKQRASELRASFTDLFSTRTGYDQLDKRIAITSAKQVDLLTVLDHPSCPLHNNASELGARVSARRRDVSLHSRSPRGAHSMDVFTTIVQTCKKMGTSAYEYFRLHLCHASQAPNLPQMILTAAGAQ